MTACSLFVLRRRQARFAQHDVIYPAQHGGRATAHANGGPAQDGSAPHHPAANATACAPAAGSFRTPLHPWSTALFAAACAAIVAVSVWNFPFNSLVGYAIIALGIPPYLYWSRAHRPTALPDTP